MRRMFSVRLLSLLVLALTSVGCDDDPVVAGPIDTGMETDAEIETDLGLDMDVGEDAGDMTVEADMDVDAEPVEPNPCEPCDNDETCQPAGSVCADLRDGQFCLVPCDEDDACDDGYECVDADGSMVCIPLTNSCGACEDGDGDGYGEGPGCLGTDCRDDDPEINAGVSFDLCDGADNDCDGSADEDYEPESCGIGACQATSACLDGAEVACQPGGPIGDDSTCDGVDDNCDGSTDENYMPSTCGEGVCGGTSACVDGAEQACTPLDPPSADDATCDNVDEDCDGRVDEDFIGDACGVGACGAVGVCVDGASMCSAGDPISVDDARCDGIDADCDGLTDEDYVTDANCGVGACRQGGQCVDGAYACTPGAPLADNDVSPDGVDDDCDGLIDEDAQQNRVGLSLHDSGNDFIEVDVEYSQIVSDAVDPLQYRPRTAEIRVTYPAALDLRVPDQDGVIPGAAVVAAEKDISVIRTGPGQLRIIIISAANTNRIGPGDLFRMRFTHAAGLQGPFEFGFNAERTNFAPETAGEILSVDGASLGGN